MEIIKGKTIKYIKEKRTVPQSVKENLKYFNQMKKALLNALRESPKTVPQLAEVLQKPTDEVLFYLMSLLKYGFVEAGEPDDNEEYFYYKIKDNG
ncbi:hypothetical protein LA303_10770 [Candidatus Sulfidibacterium hydrothermale]|uniref:hypothetical protein n=1 Tax=Candidatus Sulfidibacterium hydrothermale TaxID=2875962 RepID=UPI001F0AD6ED|nr:hypothetical protein [Candidatus Sulfidibacterium hydrothermale]UBM61884.1 hypothetical protein LA303_10770 [Candidatus Sulfidibacterium hydrothermale]